MHWNGVNHKNNNEFPQGDEIYPDILTVKCVKDLWAAFWLTKGKHDYATTVPLMSVSQR